MIAAVPAAISIIKAIASHPSGTRVRNGYKGKATATAARATASQNAAAPQIQRAIVTNAQNTTVITAASEIPSSADLMVVMIGVTSLASI